MRPGRSPARPRRAVRTVVALAALVAILALILAGCGDPEPAPPDSAEPTALAAPGITCLGVPQTKCAEIVRDIQAQPNRLPPVGIRIVCSVPPCTERQGQVSIDVLYPDGRQDSSGSGWATADGPAPVPPGPVPVPKPGGDVAPTCIGVDAQNCAAMASSARAEVDPAAAAVLSIVVACRGTCTATAGAGTTVMTLGDGTVETQDWEYGVGG